MQPKIILFKSLLYLITRDIFVIEYVLKEYYNRIRKLARNKKLECILEYAYLNHSRLKAYIYKLLCSALFIPLRIFLVLHMAFELWNVHSISIN